MATIIVAVMLVAALRTVGASRVGQTWNTNRLRGHHLAAELLNEIIDQRYAEPTELSLFGPEATEVLVGRSAFDDVDDYAGYAESTIKRRDGATVAGFAGWERRAAVVWVSPGDSRNVSLAETDVKRITVTVTRNGATVAQLVALRTAAAAR